MEKLESLHTRIRPELQFGLAVALLFLITCLLSALPELYRAPLAYATPIAVDPSAGQCPGRV